MTIAPRPFWLACLGGLVLGAAVFVSPVTVACGVVLALIVMAAVRGLEGRERQLVLGVLGIAIALRVATILGLFISANHAGQYVTSFPFDGDGLFMKRRSLWMRSVWLGLPIEPDFFSMTFASYGWTSYVPAIALLQYLLGVAPYAVHLVNVCCYVGSAVMVHRVVRPSYGAVPALLAMIGILFMPTLFMWSVSALKESPYFLLTMCIVVGLAVAARPGGIARRLVGLGVALAALSVVDTVRGGTGTILVSGIVVAMIGTFLTRRVVLAGLVMAVAVVGGWQMLDKPSVQAQLLPVLTDTAELHINHVHSEGHSYKLLDQRLYTIGRVQSMTWPEAKRYVVSALISFVTVPRPWDSLSLSELLLIPQQVLWWGLLLFAVPGSIAGVRRDPFLTWLFLGLTLSGAFFISLTNGNIGTMVRFRDSVVPFVVCLGAMGVTSVLAKAGRRMEA